MLSLCTLACKSLSKSSVSSRTRGPSAYLRITAVCALAMQVACANQQGLDLPNGVVRLFVDDWLIESQEGLVRTLHQPQKDNGGETPVIPAEEGTTLLAYGTIVHDPRLDCYAMFVQEFPSRQMYRFLSSDGLNWKGRDDGGFEQVEINLDLEQERGTKGKPGIDLFSCYYDRNDARHPYKGWVYAANYGFDREGIYFIRSQIGLKWERGHQIVSGWAGPGDTSARVIEQEGRRVFGPGDVTLFSYDAAEDRFLGLFKFFTTEKVAAGNNLRSRAYAFVDQIDQPFDSSRIERVALLPAAADARGDRPYDEYYASTAWRYGSLWLGGLKVWHRQGDYPWSAAGCAFLKLVVSRDGLNWRKVSYCNDEGIAEVFLPNGPEGGNDGQNDGGYISEFSQGPLRIGHELIYYYSASSFGKNHPPDRRLRGGGVFRGRLRLDGFVSVDAGTCTTRKLRFSGKELYVNAMGPVEVELLDDHGSILGHRYIRGDSLKHRVRFNGRMLKDVCPTGVARIRFRVTELGRLYSFVVH